MEFQPILNTQERIIGYICAGSEFVVIRRTTDEILLWMEHYGVNITKFIHNGVIKVEEFKIRVDEWIDITQVPGGYTIDLEDYIKLLVKLVKNKIENRKLLLSFSGGKDSTASLIILSKLQDFIRFDLVVAYSHMPILEPESNVKYAERIATKLGYDLEITKPPIYLVQKYLRKEGLPYRGSRWCTYLKTRPLRELKKKISADYEVIGDHLGECRERFLRLVHDLFQLKFISHKQFKPIFPLQILDVVKIVRNHNVVHPHYLKGLTQVACTYCPYKSLYEFRISEETGHEDFIENVLKFEYNRWYKKRKISFDEFKKFALWRYKPIVGEMFIKLRNFVSEFTMDRVSLDQVRMWMSSIWTNPLPRIPILGLTKLIDSLYTFFGSHTAGPFDGIKIRHKMTN